jgi:hypothetical protein
MDSIVRVYKGDDCKGGWTLQPLGDTCSDVGVFGSVMMITDEQERACASGDDLGMDMDMHDTNG